MRQQPLNFRSSPKNDATLESSVYYTVDSFRNGIEIGRSEISSNADPREELHLALPDCARPLKPRARHSLQDCAPLEMLERRLRTISDKGDLSTACFYFGVVTDPFHPFEGKFDASVKFLRLFQRFVPGMLVLQTRSPLVVIPLAMLQGLGDHAAVTIALETFREDVVSRYTPELPSVRERLRAARALRNFGIKVHLQVAPLLPYGDLERDAKEFAQILVENGESIFVRPLNDGSVAAGQRLQSSLVAQSLLIEERSKWLKPGSIAPLIREIEKLGPEKLIAPRWDPNGGKQMSFFVA